MTTCDIDRKISLYSKLLIIYSIATGIVITMCIYLLVRLFKLYKSWRKRQEKFKQHTKLDTSVSIASNFQNMLVMNSGGTQDTEIYNNKISEEIELPEYTFDKNLDSIVESYKTNMGQTCKNTNTDPERAFIQKEYDNY